MASHKRPNPLDVSVPRPVRDGMYGPMRFATVLLGFLLLVLVNALTAQKLHRETGLLHEGVKTIGRVVRVRYWDGGRSHGSEVIFSYPVGSRTETGVDLTTIANGRAFEAAGSFPVWYLPKEPGIRTLWEPTQDDVNLAVALRYGGFALVALFVGGLLLRLGLHRRQDFLDLRLGVAYHGRILSHESAHTNTKICFVYGPHDTPGECEIENAKFAEKAWSEGQPVTVLQREGHPSRIWETIESVELAPEIAKKPVFSPPGS